MLVTMIFIFAGVVLGAISLGQGGWLAGGIIGFLMSQFVTLSDKINRLQRDLNELKAQSLVKESKPDSAAQVAEPVPKVAQPQTPPKPVVSAPASQAIIPDTPKPSAAPIPAAMPTPPTTQAPKPQPRPAQARPVYQRQPPQPNAIDKVFESIVGFFTKGNPIVRVGMVVMFFGLAFLVKYAASEGYFPLELRLSAVALIALGLLILGWKTRNREGGYGQVLQGGGIAALYLTVFAALKLYHLLPASVALSIMLLVVALGVLLALLQNAQVLALMASAGGFLAPILTSDGSGSHMALFSFYLVLNLGILAVAWVKTWQLLNWVGFVFTFVITAAWGVLRYQPEFYSSTQPFLVAFYALYLCVSVLFSLKQPPKLAGLVDGSLVFGLPIVGFGLQVKLLQHTEYGLSISALILAAVYLLLARFLWSRYRETHRMLCESFIALGVGFATLAIPLALDARWTSATWALEAVGLLWVGLRQERWLPRVASYLLYLAAAGSLVFQWATAGLRTGPWPLISSDFISLTILAGTALSMARLLARYKEKAVQEAQLLEPATLFIAWLWWMLAGYLELSEFVRDDYMFGFYTLFISASTSVLVWTSQRLVWPLLGRTGFWLLPLMAFWLMRCLGEAALIGYSFHPLVNFGWLGIATFICCHYWVLWRQKNETKVRLASSWHLLGIWLLWLVLALEVLWWQEHLREFWFSLGQGWTETGKTLLWLLTLALPLLLLMIFVNRPRWPFDQFNTAYRVWMPVPALFGLVVWFIKASGLGGPASPYLPVLNPLDLAQAAALVLLGYAIVRNLCNLNVIPQNQRYGLLGGIGFIWINLVVMRAIHHYEPVVYRAEVLWASDLVQMSLSILWSLCALAVMRISQIKQDRHLWIIGASLLGLVVLKLFTRDLSGTGTLARVISFMAVGGLMLLIGYLSPIPKKAEEKL
jgi:uncharacterized membrane protein